MSVRLISTTTITLMALALSACGNSPSNSLAEAEMRKAIEASRLSNSLEITNLKRENGWANQDESYTVKYTFDFKTTQPFDQMLEKLATDICQELESKKNQVSTPFNLFNLNFSSGVWITEEEAKGRPLTPRLKALVEKNQNLATLIQKKYSHENQGAICIFSAWYSLNDYGLNENTTVGTLIPRWQSLNFYKTEKGWTIGNS